MFWGDSFLFGVTKGPYPVLDSRPPSTCFIFRGGGAITMSKIMGRIPCLSSPGHWFAQGAYAGNTFLKEWGMRGLTRIQVGQSTGYTWYSTPFEFEQRRFNLIKFDEI